MASPTTSTATYALLATCFVVCVVVGIAGTVVLALIPLYLPDKSVTLSSSKASTVPPNLLSTTVPLSLLSTTVPSNLLSTTVPSNILSTTVPANLLSTVPPGRRRRRHSQEYEKPLEQIMYKD